MKLNLLPQTVSKGRALKSAWALGAAIMVGSIAAAVLMSIAGRANLADAKQSAEANAQGAADAVTTALAADTIVASAADVIRDANLSKAMIDHNDDYIKLYSDLNPFIPSFFRINSESAIPLDATTSQVTLVGTLGSYEQYSDVILALMRFKDAKTIARSGYVYDPTIVPNLTPDDLSGTPRKQNETPIPTDQLEKLAHYESQARQATYLGQGGYGSTMEPTKGAMPGESLITIVLTVSRNLQTPDPEATLESAGSASAPAAGTGAPSFGPPGMGGGMGMAGIPGGMPGPPAGAGGPAKGAGRAADSD